MNFKLYELTDMYNNILELIEDEDTDNESLNNALAAIEGDINSKAENTAKLIKNIDGHVIALKEEEKRLQAKRKVLENKRESIKEYLEYQLESIGKDKVVTPLFTVARQNNPPSVNILDEDSIPETYKKEVTTTSIDRKELLAALKEGKEVAGAEIKQGKHLRIK